MNLFSGELIRLAHIQKSDLAIFNSWLRDYEIQSLLDLDPAVPLTDERQEEWYDRAVRSKDEYNFSIRALTDDRLIGTCGLSGIDQKNRAAECGILIGDKDYWGRGYGTDAMRVMLRVAFLELNFNRVFLDVMSFNPRAVRAYEKAGFVREGTRRKAVFREGAYHDVHVMAVLREDWLGSVGMPREQEKHQGR